MGLQGERGNDSGLFFFGNMQFLHVLLSVPGDLFLSGYGIIFAVPDPLRVLA